MRRALPVFALLAPMAAAHAQSTVTVYGLLDLSVGVANAGTGNVKNMFSGVGPGSRLGFRGTEDLGDGLRANFVLEQGIAADTGGLTQGGLAWGRQVYLGLSKDWWSVSMGRQYSPMNLSLVESDALRQVYWGSTPGVGSGTYQSPGAAAGSGGHQSSARVNNSVLATATAAGFTGRLMAAAGDEIPGGSGHLLMAGGTYKVGGLQVSGTVNRFRQYATTIVAGTLPALQTEWQLGGSYDFGLAQGFVGYYSYDPSEANRPAGAPSAIDPRFNKTTSSWLGVRAPIGNGTLMTQIMRTNFEYDGPDGKGTTFALAYEYPLSKRTTLFGSYAQVNNNDQGRVSIQAATVAVFPAFAGADIKAYSVGVRHSF
jgi:GBP family porin